MEATDWLRVGLAIAPLLVGLLVGLVVLACARQACTKLAAQQEGNDLHPQRKAAVANTHRRQGHWITLAAADGQVGRTAQALTTGVERLAICALRGPLPAWTLATHRLIHRRRTHRTPGSKSP